MVAGQHAHQLGRGVSLQQLHLEGLHVVAAVMDVAAQRRSPDGRGGPAVEDLRAHHLQRLARQRPGGAVAAGSIGMFIVTFIRHGLPSDEALNARIDETEQPQRA